MPGRTTNSLCGTTTVEVNVIAQMIKDTTEVVNITV
jgi:hypothetical protein